MEELQYISQFGVLGLLGYVFIRDFWAYMKSRDTKQGIKSDEKQNVQLAVFTERLSGLEARLDKIIENELVHNAQEHKEMSENINIIKTDIAIIKDKLMR